MTTPNLSDDFKQLGLLKAAWERPERKALQSDIERGLGELGKAITQAAADFSGSETGQKVKAEAAGMREKVAAGEAEQKVRAGLQTALGAINTELQALIRKIQHEDDTSQTPA
jgi:hypothetical protein